MLYCDTDIIYCTTYHVIVGCVVDCATLPYNTSLTPIQISDESGAAVSGTPNTQFRSFYSLQCNTGHYFSQEEFGKCGKSLNAVSISNCYAWCSFLFLQQI